MIAKNKNSGLVGGQIILILSVFDEYFTTKVSKVCTKAHEVFSLCSLWLSFYRSLINCHAQN